LSYTLCLSLIALGAFSGFLSGLLGIGGGVIMVPALIMLFGIEAHKAVGISVAVIVPTALIATFKHNALGHIDFKIVAVISLTAIIGSYFGAVANNFVSENSLKKVFAVVVILIGVNMLFSSTKKIEASEVSDSSENI